MDNIKGLIKKVKLPDALGQSSDKKNRKTISRLLEDKTNEKIKLYGFIGMEVYDFSKENKIESVQIKHYLDKIQSLEEEIQELEQQKAELEAKNVGKNLCSCGYKLNPQDRFCPNCGEPVSKSATYCICGAEIVKNSKFCGFCGRSLETATSETQPVKIRPPRECICGAKVPEGQSLCFECGRKIIE